MKTQSQEEYLSCIFINMCITLEFSLHRIKDNTCCKQMNILRNIIYIMILYKPSKDKINTNII